MVSSLRQGLRAAAPPLSGSFSLPAGLRLVPASLGANLASGEGRPLSKPRLCHGVLASHLSMPQSSHLYNGNGAAEASAEFGTHPLDSQEHQLLPVAVQVL